MAEEHQVRSEEQAAEEQTETLPIVRDSTFVRLTADLAVAIDRGAEFEFAMLVHGPDPVVQVQGRTSGQTKMAASFTEVARVRMDVGPAMNLAMHIIERNLKSGRVNVAALRAALEALVTEHDNGLDKDDSVESIQTPGQN